MTAQLRALARVRHVRSLQERMAEAEAIRMAQRREEARRQQENNRALLMESLDDAKTALLANDRQGSWLAQRSGVLAAACSPRLESMVVAATQAAEEARSEFMARRRAAEQVRRLATELAAKHEAIVERRAQAALDDLFASRADWTARCMKDR